MPDKEIVENNSSEKDKIHKGWISRILTGPQYDNVSMQQQSHSSLLSDTDIIYELTTHTTKCGEMNNYLEIYQNYAQICTASNSNAELLGSWTVIYGDKDEAVHLWRYKEGYQDVDKMITTGLQDADMKKADREVARLCTRRLAVLSKSFSYWGDPKPRPASNIYDLRRYVLRVCQQGRRGRDIVQHDMMTMYTTITHNAPLQPGTMIEWGNTWVKGIAYRREFNQDVAGLFAQVGQLYVVFHLWAYPHLVARKETRETNWSKPGWDSTVAYTGI